MCTVIVSADPGARTPLLVAAIRDEMTDRSWSAPDRYWPEYPDLMGGRDLLAGGTWLAVRDGAAPRVGAVLNGRLDPDPLRARRPVLDATVPSDTVRVSRGVLPLLAASGATLPEGAALAGYDPFHLLSADPAGASLLSWDGAAAVGQPLRRGVTVVVNSGVDDAEPRAQRFTPVFAAARPDPAPDALAAAERPEDIWGPWLRLLDEAATAGVRTGGTGGADDPAALFTRAELDDGRVWASTSVTLLAFGPDGGAVRYAFTAAPGDPAAWRLLV